LIERGDIYFVDLNPARGHEQSGHRPVLVITPAAFNALTAPLVAPITTRGAFARQRGFGVALASRLSGIDGFVLCNQLRTIDLEARNHRFVERAPDEVVADVLAKIATLIS
jgi:mRNA-degrading endonuclease toxin of MazEF toxin-antitoxin module